MHVRVALSAMLYLLCGFRADGQTSFCDQVRGVTADPSVASAHWGISVTRLDGTIVCGINDAQLFRPASNNKIFTTAAALALLGKEHTLITRLEAEGEIRGEALQGNLLLVGAGDANFGAQDIPYLAPAKRPKLPAPEPATIADIEAFADAIASKGVRTIDGDIVGDDTFFAWQPYAPDWSIDDMVYGYGAPVSALSVHDNQIDFTVTPNAPTPTGSARASVAVAPAIPYYDLQASVYSIAYQGGCDERLGYQRAVGSKTLHLFGDIAPDAQPCHQAIAIEDPAEYAALALKLALEQRGVRITGVAKARHYDAGLLGGVFTERPDNDPFLQRILTSSHPAPISCGAQTIAPTGGSPAPAIRTVLATHVSAPLLADILYTNKVSQNLHAELLLRGLGAAYTCDRSERDGLHVIRQYLLHAGVDPKDFVLYDGSGLSGHDLVTPRAFTKFLAFAATQPWFADWRATLPEGGADGTLGARFKGAWAGRIFAKTGTLGESRALSGYLTGTTGQTLIFSIMVDTHLPGVGADRTMMDRMVETIAAQN